MVDRLAEREAENFWRTNDSKPTTTNMPENSHAIPDSVVASGFRNMLEAHAEGNIHFSTTSTATPMATLIHHGALNRVSMGASLLLRRRAMAIS